MRVPVIDPGRDVDFERLRLVDPAFAAAGAAGLLDHLAAAVAGRAGALDHEEALLRADLAVAAAEVAAARAGAGLGARAVAGLAGLRDLDLDLACLPWNASSRPISMS